MNHVSPDLTDEQLDHMLDNIKEQNKILKQQRVWIISMILFSVSSLVALYFNSKGIQAFSEVFMLISFGVWCLYNKKLGNLKKEFNQLCKNGRTQV